MSDDRIASSPSVGSWNPRTGVTEAEVPQTTPAELETLLASAAEAADVLRETPAVVRAAWIRAVAEVLEQHRDELVELADRETGLGPQRLSGELARTTGQLGLFEQVLADGAFLDVVIDHADPQGGAAVVPDLRRVLEPLGVVLVFSASNFPFAFSVAGGDTASALAAGCPVLVKAHEGHVCLSVRVGELIRGALVEAGAPAGAFGIVVGFDAGVAALRDRRVAACGFTGSVKGGLALQAIAQDREEPALFFGELGSLNAVVVTPEAAEARGSSIGSGFATSMLLGNGQFCTKPGVLLVPETHSADLLSSALEALEAAPAAPLLTERIRDGYRDGLATLQEAGAAILRLGGVEPREGAWATPSLFLTDADTFSSGPAELRDECFGPAALVVTYRDQESLDRAIGQLPGALTGTVHAEPHEQVGARVTRQLSRRVGRVIWNGWPTGVAVSWAMQHGGPFPATTSPQHTSVGASAVHRFLRPVVYQSVPDEVMPPVLRDENAHATPRRVDGALLPGAAAARV